jgi:hypothetical protein
MAFPLAAALPIAGGLLGGFLGGKGQSSDISKQGQQYRDWYLRQLQGQASMPLQFYGVPGYSAPGVSGGGAGMPGGVFGSMMNRFGMGQQAGGAGSGFTPPPEFAPGQDPWVAGLGNLWGDQGYVNQFLNPFQASMEESMGRTFGRQRDALGREVADLATRERAFGGTRSTVAQRLGERDINEMEADAMSRLNYQGYNDALGYGLQERGIQQGQRQNEIDAARQRFDMAQMWPMMALDRFGQGFASMPWGQQSGGGIGGFLSGAIGGALGGYGMTRPGGLFGPQPFQVPSLAGFPRAY